MERHSFRLVLGESPKLCGNCAFPRNFHIRKLGEITGFFAVIGVLMMLLFSKVALYFYKSTERPCIEYCYHAWAATSICCWDTLDKLQIQYIGLSLREKCPNTEHFLVRIFLNSG